MIALAAALALAAAAAEAPSERFDAHGCRACHRVGHAGGDSGPDLTTVGHRRTREWLERWLEDPSAWDPSSLMPHPGLTRAERAALSDFLAAQRGQAWGDRRPFSDGKAVYARAGCVACHGPAGRGGEPNPGAKGGLIPALAPLMATYTPSELKAKIRAGVRSEGAVSMPAWQGVLTEAELDLLVSYLSSLARTTSQEW